LRKAKDRHSGPVSAYGVNSSRNPAILDNYENPEHRFSTVRRLLTKLFHNGLFCSAFKYYFQAIEHR
jgi:hypothetical protein